MSTPLPPPPATTSRLRFATALTPAAALPFVASLGYFVLFADSRAVQLLYSGSKVFTLLWPLVADRFILRHSLTLSRVRIAHHLRAVPLGFAVGLLIAAGMWLLAIGPLAPLVTSATPRIQAKVTALGVAEHFVTYALVISVLHSLLEEYAWRWFLFGRLRQCVSPASAHILAALAFSAHHVVVTAQFFGLAWGFVLGGCVGIGGAVFSWLYQRQGSLIGAWIAHIFADLAIMAVGYRVLFG